MSSSPTADGSASASILVIDDEAVVCASCKRILSEEGYRVQCQQDPRAGLRDAFSGVYDLILLDIVMPEMDGLEVLKELKSAGVTAQVVIITGYATVETSVEAMKQGAADYVSKPFTPDELVVVIRKVLECSATYRETMALRRELNRHRGFEGIIGESRCMEKVFSIIKRVARTDGTVLITGDSGTGKEMVARAIHRLSPRRARYFLACDCSSLAPALLESELFGHVKGSFSGAIATKKGLFEAADGGTLFLDEVANISLEIQGKLLRAIETRTIRKVGDTDEHEVDIRLIAATNRNLAKRVGEGKFREDLRYRLDVVPIYLPPLRERTGDIPRLATIFLERFRQKNEVTVQGFTPEAMRIMESYRWPGNVRELKNMIERLAILCDADRIEPRHLPPEFAQTSPDPAVAYLPHSWEEFKELKQQVRDAAVRDLERRFLVDALQRSGGNVSRAADDIGMQRTNFHALLRKHGLTSEDI
jgi:DNA-binding NtrC family response regulator